MRVLITGAGGFVGRHLSKLLVSKKNVQVYGLVRPKSAAWTVSGVEVVEADLTNPSAIARVLKEIKPDRIYHLAAQASVALSWKDAKRTFDVNVEGTRNLFEAARKQKLRAKILVACSSDEYGASGSSGHALDENADLKPLNPYAVSKVAEDVLALHYFLNHDIPVIRTRAFNHTGPGQDDRYVVSSFAKQIAEIELGLKKPVIEVGNLKAIRDFSDVRDVVRAYALLMEKGKPGEVYNVASGKGRKIEDVLKFYLKHSSVKIKVLRAKDRMRPSDLPALVGNAAKLKKATGWKPQIKFERTLKDLLQGWKKELNA